MKKLNPKELAYLKVLGVKLSEQGIDKSFQTMIRDNKADMSAFDMHDCLELVKFSIQGLISLYTKGEINFNTYYERVIKVIGYDFMINELKNRKSDEELKAEGEIEDEKTENNS